MLKGFIDISPLHSPHTGRIGDDGRLYLCCKNSRAIVVIDTDDDRVVDQIATPSFNTHRLTRTPSGKKLFTENEEDASITAVDIAVSPGRVLDTIAMPIPIGGIAVSPRHPELVAAAADRPALYIVDSDSHQLRGTLTLDFHHQGVQVVRFNADDTLLAVIGNGEPVVTLLDGEPTPLASLNVGKKPVDGCFSPYNALLLIANEDDGNLSVIDLNLLQVIATPRMGGGCEVLGYFPLMGA